MGDSPHTPSWVKGRATATTKPRAHQTNVGLLAPKPKSFTGENPSWVGQRITPTSWDTVPERDAVRVVEELFGSLEEFGAWCVFDAPDMLNPDVSLPKKSEISGVPIGALGCLLGRSVKFRGVLRGALANQVFDVMAELQHLRVVAGIAQNEGKRVLTRSGDIAKVDNSESGVMEAGEYLNRYRGTPVAGGASSGGNTLVLNFQGAPAQPSPELEERTVTVAGKPLGVHSPLKAGSLPPKAVRGRYSAHDEQDIPVPGDVPEGQAGRSASGAPGIMGSDLDFSGGGAASETDFFGGRKPSASADGERERDRRGREPGNRGSERPGSLKERLERAKSGSGRGFEGYGAGASTVSEGFGEGFASPEGADKPSEARREPVKPS